MKLFLAHNLTLAKLPIKCDKIHKIRNCFNFCPLPCKNSGECILEQTNEGRGCHKENKDSVIY